MKKPFHILLACLFAIGLLSSACDNPLSDFINNPCTQSDAEDCQDDYTECRDAIDPESDTAEEEQTACTDDLCDCLEDKNCDDWISSDDCG